MLCQCASDLRLDNKRNPMGCVRNKQLTKWLDLLDKCPVIFNPEFRHFFMDNPVRLVSPKRSHENLPTTY